MNLIDLTTWKRLINLFTMGQLAPSVRPERGSKHAAGRTAPGTLPATTIRPKSKAHYRAFTKAQRPARH